MTALHNLLCQTIINYSNNLCTNGNLEQWKITQSWIRMYNDPEPFLSPPDTAQWWKNDKKNYVRVNADHCAGLTHYSSKGISHSGYVACEIVMFNVLESWDSYGTVNASIELCRPLTAGHKYIVKFYIRTLGGNKYAEQIDVLLHHEKRNVYLKHDFNDHELAALRNSTFSKTFHQVFNTKEYQKLSFEYIAQGRERYITIGNLSATLPRKPKKIRHYGVINTIHTTPVAKCLIDDISVVPLDTSEAACPDIQTKAKCHEASTDTVTDITYRSTPTLVYQAFFESDSDITKFAPDSLLNAIFSYDVNKYRVLIKAYTDERGSEIYNSDLASRRALFFKDFIHKYLKHEIQIISLGESEAINHSNNSILSAYDRRVDILIELKR